MNSSDLLADQQRKVAEAAKNLYDHTVDECGKCRAPYSCCSPEYCDMAQQIAIDDFGTDISSLRTDNRIPFLGHHGCLVAPHFRPLCIMHVCAINNLGFKPGDAKWTKVYFKLRTKYEFATSKFEFTE